MKKCESCGARIVFGGKRKGQFRFCNSHCYNKGGGYLLFDSVSEDDVDEVMLAVHQGDCPVCEGPGPVDVHLTYDIWAILFWTSLSTTPNICCQMCGQKKRFVAILGAFFLGWWSFPTGIIMTPIQIARNIAGMVSLPDTSLPSIEMEHLIRMDIANTMYKQHNKGNRSIKEAKL